MKSRPDGFTVIEVLIAIMIFSVALLALAQLQVVTIGGNSFADKMTAATVLAQDKIEELRALAYDDTQLTDTQDNFTLDTDSDGTDDYFDWSLAVDHTNADGPGGVANPIDQDGNSVVVGGFNRVWNVAEDTPGTNMKMVSVRVTWTAGRTHIVTMDTIITR
jgi:prepilin-type N-terminal cleavage/methylation domain-containing protein